MTDVVTVQQENARLRALVAALSERLAAAAAVLSRCAERGAVVRCLRCSACRGRGRFELSPVCHWCAGSGLELTAAAGTPGPTGSTSFAAAVFGPLLAACPPAGVAVVDDPEADLSRLADDGGPHAGEG